MVRRGQSWCKRRGRWQGVWPTSSAGRGRAFGKPLLVGFVLQNNGIVGGVPRQRVQTHHVSVRSEVTATS